MHISFIALDPREATPLLAKGDTVLIDVREWPDTLQARIPGSHNLPYSTLTGEQMLDQIQTSQQVIIYCYHGIRSQAACLMLREIAPHLTIYNLTGGFAAWEGAGLPTSGAKDGLPQG